MWLRFVELSRTQRVTLLKAHRISEKASKKKRSQVASLMAFQRSFVEDTHPTSPMIMNQTQTRPRRASSKRPSRPKPKGNGQPTRTRCSLANGRTVEGA